VAWCLLHFHQNIINLATRTNIPAANKRAMFTAFMDNKFYNEYYSETILIFSVLNQVMLLNGTTPLILHSVGNSNAATYNFFYPSLCQSFSDWDFSYWILKFDWTENNWSFIVGVYK
jgi:hypothetical protein